MASAGLWPDLLKNFDKEDSRQQALQTARKLFERAGEGATTLAATLVPIVANLETPEGQQMGLALLAPYAAYAGEVADLALDMSRSETPLIRSTASSVVTSLSGIPKFRERVLELLSEPETGIRNQAIAALETMELPEAEAGTGFSLHVIPDDTERSEALALLDELARAVKMLQDLGLDEGQNLIIDELILPRIDELKRWLGDSVESVQQVAEQRKHSLLSLTSLRTSA